MVVINPQIEDTLEFENIDWEPLLNAHNKRSSEVLVSPDKKYFKKSKRRKGRKRDNEFYNLIFWNELLNMYHKKTNSGVFAPQPYISEGRDLIMDYVCGTDLDRLHTPHSLTQDDLGSIMRKVGMLQRIKINENLIHSDFDLRHILVCGGIYVIDIEKAKCGTTEVEKENERLTGLIQIHFKKGSENFIREGFESIPTMSLFDAALQKVVSVYNDRAEYFLKTRYRR